MANKPLPVGKKNSNFLSPPPKKSPRNNKTARTTDRCTVLDKDCNMLTMVNYTIKNGYNFIKNSGYKTTYENS